MAKSKYDPKVYVSMREQGMTNYEIARTLTDVDEASVRRGLAKVGYKPYLLPTAFQKKLAVSLETPIWINATRTGLGGGAICSDFHLPLTNWSLVNEFIDHARDIKATKWCVIAGDFFNIDSLSQFDFKQAESSLGAEQYAGNEVMRKLLETFEHIYFSWGNHDARVHKALGYSVDFGTAMRMMLFELTPEEMSRITFSNLDYVLIHTAQGDYRVNHPKAYSSAPLTQARKMASKYLCHIVNAHSHHTAISHDLSGKFVCAELGGFFEKDKTLYLQRTTSFANWQNGYGFIDNDGYLVIEGAGWSSRAGKHI